MTVKFLDLTGLGYFKSKLNTENATAIQSAINTALASYSQDLWTVSATLPQSGVEGRGYLVPNATDGNQYDVWVWEITNSSTNPPTYGWTKASSAHISVTIDTALSSSSTNPVQNKVIKAALDGKAASSHTHGNITNDGKLATADRAVITGSDKKITVSSVTSTELGYVAGVTSAIQTQLNSKVNSSDLVAITNSEIDGLFS